MQREDPHTTFFCTPQDAGVVKNKCHTWSFLVYFYSVCFLFMVFSILELWCLDFKILVLFTIFAFCIPHSGIMLPPFYVTCYIFTPCAFCILELCCLDSLIIDYLRTVFGIHRIYGNYVASIP